MKTVRIPKSGLPQIEPAFREPDTPVHRRIRAVLTGIAFLLYFALVTLMLTRGVRPFVMMQAGFGILAFLLIILPRIRPGTGTFWASCLGLLAVLVPPVWLSGFGPAVRLASMALYGALALAAIWTSRESLREETMGWRLIFFGGLLAGLAYAALWLIP